MQDDDPLNRSDVGFPRDIAAELSELPGWTVQPPADPAALAQLERERQFDARVAEVLHEAPLPEGLAERIMARLSVATEPVAGASLTIDSARGPRPDEDLATSPAASLRDDAAHRSAAALRRRWRLASGWLATAAALLLIAYSGHQFALRPSWTLPQVLEQAIAFHDQHARELHDASSGTLPFSRTIRQPASAVGRQVVGLLSCEGAAYDINKGKVHATLYVLRLKISGVPTTPPARPDSVTGGHSVAIWQEGDLLYVLVVDGGQPEYRIVSQRVVT